MIFFSKNLKKSQPEPVSKFSYQNEIRCSTSTPCTLDTAYSSMKQSSSPSSSFSSEMDYDEIITSTRIKSFLQSSESDIDITETYDIMRRNRIEHSPEMEILCQSYQNVSNKLWGDFLRDEMHQKIGKKDFLIENNFANFNDVASRIKNAHVKKTISKTNNLSTIPAKKRQLNENLKFTSTERFSKRRRIIAKMAKEQIVEVSKPLPKRKSNEEKIIDSLKKKEDLDIKHGKLIDRFILKRYHANYIFKDAPKDIVCEVCLKPNNVIRCKGNCGGNFHRKCKDKLIDYNNGLGPRYWYKQLKDRISNITNSPTIDLVTGEDFMAPSILCENIDTTEITCNHCSTNQISKCFVCFKSDGELIKCCERQCGSAYHMNCLKYWPQHKLNYAQRKADENSAHIKSICCPRHVCHTCISNNPKLHYTVENSKKLIKCVLCPGSYHRVSACLPAGSEILSESQIICPRHRKNTNQKPVNTNFCLLCGNYGELLCCDTCPGSFHQECLKITIDDRYICEECESGRLPLYGEIVWAKYGACQWWPAIIVPPPNIPLKVKKAKPDANYICVCFFGTYDYGWICRDRMYLFDEADKSCTIENKNPKLCVAIASANDWYNTILSTSAIYADPKNYNLKPQSYTKIRINHFVHPAKFEGNECFEDECECSATDVSPCSEDSNCLNYVVNVECKNTCNAGSMCKNQRFEKRQYVPLESRHVDAKGWGMFAKETIPPNTFIIEYVGEVITANEFRHRYEAAVSQQKQNFYFLSLGNGLYIDAEFKGNIARFINHSCDPNCITQKWRVNKQTRIGLFSAKEIQAVN